MRIVKGFSAPAFKQFHCKLSQAPQSSEASNVLKYIETKRARGKLVLKDIDSAIKLIFLN